MRGRCTSRWRRCGITPAIVIAAVAIGFVTPLGLFGALLVSQVIPDRPVWHRTQGAAWPIHRWPGADAADMAARFTSILRGLLD